MQAAKAMKTIRDVSEIQIQYLHYGHVPGLPMTIVEQFG